MKLLIFLISVNLYSLSINCSKSNEQKSSLSLVQNILKKCTEVNSVEKILPLLPGDLRSRHTLMYSSRSLGEGTVLHPRVIMFGSDAKLIMAFAGEKKLRGYSSLEFIEYNEKERSFDFQEVTFPQELDPKSEKRYKFSSKNPSKCLACHRNQAPIWDTYELWPGAYGSLDDKFFGKEKEHFERYQTEIHNTFDRYKYFTDYKKYPWDSDIKEVYSFYPKRKNLQFGYLLTQLNGRKISRQLAERIKKSKQGEYFKYAILSALTCNVDDDEYGRYSVPLDTDNYLESIVTKPYIDPLKKNYKTARELLLKEREDSFTKRDKRQCHILRKLGAEDPTCKARRTESTLLKSNLKAFTDMLEIKIDDFSLELSTSSHMMNPGPHYEAGGLRVFFWKEILDPIKDKNLYSMYKDAFNSRFSEGEYLWFKKGADKELPLFNKSEVCLALAKKSIDEISKLSK